MAARRAGNAVYRCLRWCCVAWKRIFRCVTTSWNRVGLLDETSTTGEPQRQASQRLCDQQRQSTPSRAARRFRSTAFISFGILALPTFWKQAFTWPKCSAFSATR